MNQSKPITQHADAVHSGAFTGNLQRASLLPGEIAARPPVSQEVRAATGTGGYPQPGGASIYQRNLAWWYWLAIAALVVLTVYGLNLVLSDSAALPAPR